MTTEEIDLVEEILGPTAAHQWDAKRPPESEPATQPPNPYGALILPASNDTSTGWDATPFGGSAEYVKLKHYRWRNPFTGRTRNSDASDDIDPDADVREAFRTVGRSRAATRRRTATRIAVAFALAAVATTVLIAAAAAIAFGAYANRAVPGVRVGSIDVTGMSRDQIVARLKAEYQGLGHGQATITTPQGFTTVTYSQAGREPDIEAMTDAAMSVGHSGYPLTDAVSMLRSAAYGRTLPVIVRIDPTALAVRIRQLVGTVDIPAKNAAVTAVGGSFVASTSTQGKGVDEKALSNLLIEELVAPGAPADIRITAPFVELDPRVSTDDAAAAIAAAAKMTAPLAVSWDGAAPANNPSLTSMAPGTATVDASTLKSWIVFGTRGDGIYGPTTDPSRVGAYVSALSKKIGKPAVEPSVVYDKTGKPSSLKGGMDGLGLEVTGSAQAIERYLDALGAGGSPAKSVALTTGPVSPRLTIDSLTGMVIIGGGQGKWTTTFYPDVSNGMGANIRVPANLLNGQVVAPGQQFSFLAAVSPIDLAHGYAMGGVIVHGKSDHTGAIGGGICSASTTMFNAAARAGLQIDERHAHSYYINRYPVGLDATVYQSSGETMDLRWTNDTPNPILIRARTTKGSKSTITIELWSLPLDRIVSFSPEHKDKIIKAADHTVYVTTLTPGQKNRAEYPTDGFDTSRTRTVTDSAGNVIHTDTWNSHYIKVDGLQQIGVKAIPSPTPKPTPSPASLPAEPATIDAVPSQSSALGRRIAA